MDEKKFIKVTDGSRVTQRESVTTNKPLAITLNDYHDCCQITILSFGFVGSFIDKVLLYSYPLIEENKLHNILEVVLCYTYYIIYYLQLFYVRKCLCVLKNDVD